jgi:hypothetical protein
VRDDEPGAQEPCRNPLIRASGCLSLTGNHRPHGLVLNKVRVPRLGPGRPRTRPDRVRADKAYASRKNRAYLRWRGVRCTIPDKADQARNRKKRGSHGGRPPKFDPQDYQARRPAADEPPDHA